MRGLAEFRGSLDADAPPLGLTVALEAMWWDAKGDWTRAHERAMAADGADGALVHAYLHRKEGDLPNAGYWYRRAGREAFKGSTGQEWETMVRELLGR